MAQKRMFDRAIIDTDNFMDLSMSSKALYFLLGMEADDEGFVSPKKTMRVYGGNEDDLKVLVIKKFVIPFRSGVVVITDWQKNNWLDARRIKSTEYQAERELLAVNNGKYELLSNRLATAKTVESRVVESSIEEKSTDSGLSPQEVIFSLKEEIQKLEENPRRDLNIIGLYFRERNPNFSNKEQYSIALKRHLRAAKLLISFTDSQIISATNFVKTKYPEWTIETIMKQLTK